MSLRTIAAILLLACAMLTATAKSPMLSAKEVAKIEKQSEKDAKKTAKDLRKEGWKIEQTGSMEAILARHIVRRDTEGLMEKPGSAFGRKSISGCRKQILNDVSNTYAREQSQVVKGLITSKDRFKDADEAEDFIGEYETRLASEIAGELVESYALYRRNADGTFDMRIIYFVDPEAAQAAKRRAARNTIELQKLDEEWRQSISNAINGTEE